VLSGTTGCPEREHNARGFFAIGPQCVTPSDLLVRQIEFAQLPVSIFAAHYRADILEDRRAQRIHTGRRNYRARRRSYVRHGLAEFYGLLR
jgi:hypothetical protein